MQVIPLLQGEEIIRPELVDPLLDKFQCLFLAHLFRQHGLRKYRHQHERHRSRRDLIWCPAVCLRLRLQKRVKYRNIHAPRLKLSPVLLPAVQLFRLDLISRNIAHRLIWQKPLHLTVSVSVQDQLLHAGRIQAVKSPFFSPERHDCTKIGKNTKQCLLHISLRGLLCLCQEFGLFPLEHIVHRNDTLGSFQLIEKIRFHIHHRGLDPGKVASCPVRPASDQLLLLVTRALAVDPERHIQIPIVKFQSCIMCAARNVKGVPQALHDPLL